MTRVRVSTSNARLDRYGARQPMPQADTPIPSIERNESIDTALCATPSTSNDHYQIRTPSLSVSPPGDEEENSSSLNSLAGALDGSDARPRATTDISGEMARLQMKSMEPLSDYADFTAAIEAAEREPRSRVESLAPDGPVTPGRASLTPRKERRRSRSNSNVNAARHDVADEELPDDSFSSIQFQRAFKGTQKLVEDLHRALGSSALHQEPASAMYKLHQQSAVLEAFRPPATRTVGFVGDSGVGKSSLLNSLLDSASLVRASNSGAACTCVVTEFHYHEHDTFNIETTLFDETELMEQLMQMLENYRYFHSMGSEIEQEEHHDFEEKAQLAEDTFRSMFRTRLRGVDSLLSQPLEYIRETFRSWVTELRPSESDGSRTGLTQDACSSILKKLSSETAAHDEPGVWPYICKIKVFLKAHILSKGLVLVDLPGLRDLNTARRNITERFLYNCDEIFAVCKIGRAVTDAGVQSVFNLAKHTNLGNVGIICTRSDDIIAEEAILDWGGPEAKQVQELQQAIATDKRDLEELEAEIADYTPEDGEDELDEAEEYQEHLNSLLRRRPKIVSRHDSHKFELVSYLVRTRNAIVSRKLVEAYESQPPGAEVKVFCVSNALYKEKRKRSRDISLPYLTLSGILDVRKHCISIVSNSQHRIASHYMCELVPALLAEVELWVQSGADTLDAEQRAAVRSTISTLENRLSTDLRGHNAAVHDVKRSLQRHFRANLQGVQRVSEWNDGAVTACKEWETWAHQSYSAFCRKYRTHSTGAIGYRNWNEEAIKAMVGDLEGPWLTLDTFLQTQKNEAVDSAMNLTDWGIDYLAEELDGNIVTIAPLRQALVSQQNVLMYDIEEAFEQAETRLRTIRIESLSSLRSSYIGVAMEASYDACMYESGTGSHSRRKAIIRGTLSDESLFHDIMAKMRGSFHTLTDTAQAEIDAAVESYLSKIQRTLDLVRSENIAEESQRGPAFRDRVSQTVQSASFQSQEIHRELNLQVPES